MIAFPAFAKEPQQPPPIGLVEHVELSFQKARIPVDVKVDTGAATSSLHAIDIKVTKDIVRFRFSKNGEVYEAPLVRRGKVKSSDGESEGRYFVEAKICTGSIRHPILISLNDRSKMKYPMLLGRDFLRGKFLVDSSSQNLLPKPSCDFQASMFF